MIDRIVIVGLGNRYRSDDGVGVAAAVALKDLALPNVDVVTDIAEPTGLLDVWSGARLAVIIDAAIGTISTVGRVCRYGLGDLAMPSAVTTSHDIDIRSVHNLAQILDRAPDEVSVITVEVIETGHGMGLTPSVQRAVPAVVAAAVDEINRVRTCVRGWET